MESKNHICPFGIKAKYLLKRSGYQVADHLLSTREQADAFKEKHDVKTTPQIFIDDKRIGGYDDLVNFLNIKTLKQEGTTYQPIIAVFAVTFLMALVFSFALGQMHVLKIVESFVAISMCVLGILKLRDLYAFTNQFISYDLLAKRWVPYAYLYPFIETLSGILMIGQLLTWLYAPAILITGSIGAVSVIKAVYIDRRALKCACVGGESSVPLGFISLTENLMMVLMALWMLLK